MLCAFLRAAPSAPTVSSHRRRLPPRPPARGTRRRRGRGSLFTRDGGCRCRAFLVMEIVPKAGLAFDSLQQVFRKADIKIAMAIQPMPFQHNNTIFVVIDPVTTACMGFVP